MIFPRFSLKMSHAEKDCFICMCVKMCSVYFNKIFCNNFHIKLVCAFYAIYFYVIYFKVFFYVVMMVCVKKIHKLHICHRFPHSFILLLHFLQFTVAEAAHSTYFSSETLRLCGEHILFFSPNSI